MIQSPRPDNGPLRWRRDTEEKKRRKSKQEEKFSTLLLLVPFGCACDVGVMFIRTRSHPLYHTLSSPHILPVIIIDNSPRRKGKKQRKYEKKANSRSIGKTTPSVSSAILFTPGNRALRPRGVRDTPYREESRYTS